MSWKILEFSTPTDTEFYFLIITVPLIVLSRYVLTRFNKKIAMSRTDNERRLNSICDSMYFFEHYLFTTLINLYCIHDQGIPLFSPHKDWIDHHNRPIVPSLKLMYMWHISYYLYGIFNSSCEYRKKYSDAINMFIHHVVTALILFLVYHNHWTYVGTITLLVHDVSDVILEFSKCMHYFNMDNIVTFTLPLTLCWWLFGRMSWCPHRWVTSYITALNVNAYVGHEIPCSYIIWSILFVLYILNMVWGTMIGKIIVSALNDIWSDIRSEDDVEDAVNRKKFVEENKID